MRDQEKAQRLIEQAITAINKEIDSPCLALVKHKITPRKLQMYQAELHKMLEEVKTGTVSQFHQRRTWMGRTVIDGWPLITDARQGCDLGTLIIQAEDAYEAIPITS